MRKSKLAKFLSKRNSTGPKDQHQRNNDVASKVKMYNRSEKRDGYNPGQDERVYESRIKGSGIVSVRDDYNKRHDDKIDKEGVKHVRKFGPQKQPDFSKMKRVEEGYYSEKDIARQEAEYAKKHHPKSIMMDKIADMHKKGKLTPEAKKLAVKQMNKMQESVDFLYENWNEFRDYSEEELFEALEKHQIAAQKAFGHLMKGRPLKKGEFQYTGNYNAPTQPSHYLEPELANKLNKYDANGKFINSSKKRGILSRLLRREDVDLEEKEINEGLLRSVSRYLMQDHIKAKLTNKLEKLQEPHNDAINVAGDQLRKLNDTRKFVTRPEARRELDHVGGDIADAVQPNVRRSVQLGRRMSALKPDKSGNVFKKDWPKTPDQLNYLSGKSRIGNKKAINIQKESLDEANKLTRALDKYLGNKTRRVYGKQITRLQRHDSSTKSGDDWHKKSLYKGPKITTGGDEV